MAPIVSSYRDRPAPDGSSRGPASGGDPPTATPKPEHESATPYPWPRGETPEPVTSLGHTGGTRPSAVQPSAAVCPELPAVPSAGGDLLLTWRFTPLDETTGS